ncbi:MAG: bacterial Ig-like domain-containing protein, partial [Oscillospiraceae bacterium]|nr:bacterial Ig-like domain-containing protein [Oscillospiraceae bacterium]
MKTRIKKALSLFVIVCMLIPSLAIFDVSVLQASALTTNITAAPEWFEVPNADLSVGTFVAAYNATSTYNGRAGIKTTAQGNTASDGTSNSSILQNLIDRIYNLGGGTLYIPAGRYRIGSTITLRKGVTIRGAWVEPVKGQPIDPAKNTILETYVGASQSNPVNNTGATILMEPESCVANLTFFYPNQNGTTITAYGPTILMGVNGYFGNEYSNVRNVTMVNSYIGFQFNYTNGGASPTINGVYGSPLNTGVMIDAIADIGRIENLHFSPDYWIGSNLASTAMTDAQKRTIRDYIYNTGVGVDMRRNDWSFTCYLDIEAYNIGYRASSSPAASTLRGDPNGHHYGFKFTGCKTGIQIDNSAGVGIIFSDIKVDECEKGIVIPASNGSYIQFNNADIKAKRTAIEMRSGVLMINSTIIRQGHVLIDTGTFNSVGNIFMNDSPQITYGYTARGILTDNEFTNTYAVTDNSIYRHDVINTRAGEYSYANIVPPSFPNEVAKPLAKGPQRTNVYVVSDANAVKFPAVNNSLAYTTTTSTADSTALIQSKLDQAAAAGGGVVFAPPGKYRIAGSLTIPSGVELRGAGAEIATVPHGTGTVFEIYGNKGTPTGPSPIIMQANSGMRGIVFNYPEQTIWNITAGKLITSTYPYTIQGRGDNIYVINVGLRAVYKGLDFDTYRCDNLYLDFVTGHVFNQALKYGRGGEGAIIKNVMVNTLIFGAGDESKFGSWNNSDRSKITANPPGAGSNSHVGTYSYENLDFMELGDCKNTYMYNNFHYGSMNGIHFMNQGGGGPQNTSNLGLSIDGARQSINFDTGLTGTYNFINSQTVSTNGGTYSDATYMVSKGNNSGFTANFYGSDYWGQPRYAFNMAANSGKINLFSANIQETGSNFLNLAGGQLSFINSTVRGNTAAATNSQNYLKVVASQMAYTDTLISKRISPYGLTASEGKIDWLARSAWTRTWTNRTTSGAAANVIVDGDAGWTAGTISNGTTVQALQIDMGASRTYRFIEVEWEGPNGNDYPIGDTTALAVQVYQSNTAAPTGWGTVANTTNFTQVAAATVMPCVRPGKMIIDLGANTTQRYIMLRLAGNQTAAGNWGVKNIRVGTLTAASPILSATGWAAKAKITSGTNNASNALAIGNANQWIQGTQSSSTNAFPQWFMVDKSATVQTYTHLLLMHGGGSSGNGGDWPRGAEVFTGTNTANCWTAAANTTAGDTSVRTTGASNWTKRADNFGAATVIDLGGARTDRYIMIKRDTGAPEESLYWAIREFRLANFAALPTPTTLTGYTLRQSSYLGYRIIPEPGYTLRTNAAGEIKFRLAIDPDFITGTLTVQSRSNNNGTLTAVPNAGGVYTISSFAADLVLEVGGVTKKTAQTIAFPNNNATQDMVKGTSTIYPITVPGAGTGAVTYESANPLIATVDPDTGEVTAQNVGTTVIRAFKEADATYASAEAEYLLIVTETATEKKTTQTIAFPDDNAPVTMVKDDVLPYPLEVTGPGVGGITYTSSNTLVATVDPDTGEVTAIAAGTALIKADKAPDTTYAAATAGYMLTVLAAPKPLVSFAKIDYSKESIEEIGLFDKWNRNGHAEHVDLGEEGWAYAITKKSFVDGDEQSAFFAGWTVDPTVIAGTDEDVTVFIVYKLVENGGNTRLCLNYRSKTSTDAWSPWWATTNFNPDSGGNWAPVTYDANFGQNNQIYGRFFRDEWNVMEFRLPNAQFDKGAPESCDFRFGAWMDQAEGVIYIRSVYAVKTSLIVPSDEYGKEAFVDFTKNDYSFNNIIDDCPKYGNMMSIYGNGGEGLWEMDANGAKITKDPIFFPIDRTRFLNFTHGAPGVRGTYDDNTYKLVAYIAEPPVQLIGAQYTAVGEDYKWADNNGAFPVVNGKLSFIIDDFNWFGSQAGGSNIRWYMRENTVKKICLIPANSADKTLLIAAINNEPSDSTIYTDESWAPYMAELAAGGLVRDDIYAMQSEVNEATKAINDTYAKLKRKLVSIAVTAQPTKDTYILGESFSSAGLAVAATYAGSVSAPVTGYTLSVLNGTVLNTPGTVTVTVTYIEGGITATTTFTVTVKTPITTAPVTVTEPALGAAPSGTATSASADFTLGTVTWAPTDNPFTHSTAYKATVTLTAAANKTFTGITAANVTINGQQATIDSNNGTTLTISYIFGA